MTAVRCFAVQDPGGYPLKYLACPGIQVFRKTLFQKIAALKCYSVVHYDVIGQLSEEPSSFSHPLFTIQNNLASVLQHLEATVK
jgi:hypothetical protein